MESIFLPDDLIPISTPRGLLHLIPGSIAVPRTNDTLNLIRGGIQTPAVTSVMWGLYSADKTWRTRTLFSTSSINRLANSPLVY